MAKPDILTAQTKQTGVDHKIESPQTLDINSTIADAAASAYSPTAFLNMNKVRLGEEYRAALRSFTSQELPNFPANNRDCGPTSLVTVLKNDGIVSKTGNAAAQENAVRLRMTGAENPLQGTDLKQLVTAAQSYGLTTQRVTGLAQLNAALAQGKQVIEGGAPSFVLNGVNFEGNNVNNAPTARHFITVFGFNQQTGKYIVDNPARPQGSGPQEKTVAQMKAFISDLGLHSGVAISSHSPDAKPEPPVFRHASPRTQIAPIPEVHHNSIGERFRRAGNIDIQIPLFTWRF